MNSSQTMPVAHHVSHSDDMHRNAYGNLLGASAIHFVIMYAVMYTMVANLSDVFINLNNVYMTGMMLAPMTLLMILSMRKMYPNKKLNYAIAITVVVLFGTLYAFMRNQTFVDDKEFIRSMIPHHSGAILMCSESKINDPELKNLCAQIIEGQRNEIDQMKKILSRL